MRSKKNKSFHGMILRMKNIAELIKLCYLFLPYYVFNINIQYIPHLSVLFLFKHINIFFRDYACLCHSWNNTSKTSHRCVRHCILYFQFDSLVTAVLSDPVLDCLAALGCSSLTLQTGACAEVRVPRLWAEEILIKTYQYKPSLCQVSVRESRMIILY